MKKVILIKYGELSTKKDNINFFLVCLKENILAALKNMDVEIKYDLGRMFIYSEGDYDAVMNRVTKIFGIHEINLAYVIDSTNFEVVADEVLGLLKSREFRTFKVESKRSNKKISGTSVDLSREMGARILKAIPGLKVDVNRPEIGRASCRERVS